MSIHVLAFGIVREIVGASAVTVEVSNAVTVAELKAELNTNYPRLATLASYAIAVNGEYAANDVTINTGDEIAIIPPVSGG